MKVMRLVLVLLIALLVPTHLCAQRASSDHKVFRPVLSLLRSNTHVPLRLPTYLATEHEEYPLHAVVEEANPARFVLLLAFSPNCNGANVCRYGIVSGRAVGAKAKRPTGREVRLARGIAGYFVDATCEAYCSDSTLTWDQGGYRYTVGIKAAKAEKLMKVANSAIRRGAVTR